MPRILPGSRSLSCPQSTFGDLGSFWQLVQGIKDIKRPGLKCLGPLVEVKGARQENNLKP